MQAGLGAGRASTTINTRGPWNPLDESQRAARKQGKRVNVSIATGKKRGRHVSGGLLASDPCYDISIAGS